MDTAQNHPTKRWAAEPRQVALPHRVRLRLAAIAGHMRLDKISSRRAALIDLLADGRPHPREEIWQTVAAQLDDDCWGKVPQEALARDLAALRRGGIRIGYARRREFNGYYLQYPPLEEPPSTQFASVNWQLIAAISALSVADKNKRAFAAADFALRQKKLLLAAQQPDLTATELENEARRLVFGVDEVGQ